MVSNVMKRILTWLNSQSSSQYNNKLYIFLIFFSFSSFVVPYIQTTSRIGWWRLEENEFNTRQTEHNLTTWESSLFRFYAMLFLRLSRRLGINIFLIITFNVYNIVLWMPKTLRQKGWRKSLCCALGWGVWVSVKGEKFIKLSIFPRMRWQWCDESFKIFSRDENSSAWRRRKKPAEKLRVGTKSRVHFEWKTKAFTSRKLQSTIPHI